MSPIHSLIEEFYTQENIITEYKIQPYNIRLIQPWKTASSQLFYRQGLLISLTINSSSLADGSLNAIGECAPMPEIGTETLAQAQNFLFHRLSRLKGTIWDKSFLSDLELLPACHFALESLLLGFIAQQQQQSIALLFNPDATQTIKTNVMLGSLDDWTSLRIKDAEQRGFDCIKLKLGINNIKTEVEKLHQLLKQIAPATRIRLDANKNWSLQETQYILNELKACQHQIDSIEEPLLNFDSNNYQNLQYQTSISLALDESVSLALADKQFPELFPVKRIILKPMAQGGIINTLKMAETAQKSNIEVVITSAIETGYGLEMISQCCAALNNNQYHGIATSSWLEDSLKLTPVIKEGLMTINSPQSEAKLNQ